MLESPELKKINPWNYKPWWCQPWSIVFTGMTIIISSWLLFKLLWVTLLISLPILIWMGFFLLLWPRLVVASGLLETKEFLQSDSGSES